MKILEYYAIKNKNKILKIFEIFFKLTNFFRKKLFIWNRVKTAQSGYSIFLTYFSLLTQIMNHNKSKVIEKLNFFDQIFSKKNIYLE